MGALFGLIRTAASSWWTVLALVCNYFVIRHINCAWGGCDAYMNTIWWGYFVLFTLPVIVVVVVFANIKKYPRGIGPVRGGPTEAYRAWLKTLPAFQAELRANIARYKIEDAARKIRLAEMFKEIAVSKENERLYQLKETDLRRIRNAGPQGDAE